MKRERSSSSETELDRVPRHGIAIRNASDVRNQAVRQNVEGHLYTGTVNNNTHNVHTAIKTEDSKERILADKANDILKALMNSLTFQRMNARFRNIEAPHARTSEWLFDHQKFRDWNDDSKVKEHHGFIWIKGNPGSGKSVTIKTALNWVKTHRRREVITHYFFNARASSELEKSSLGLYRSLTYEILRAYRHTQAFFLESYSSKSTDGVIEDWTSNELRDFLLHAVTDLRKRRLNLFIDALDEGSDEDVRPMIGFLEDLACCAVSSQTPLRIFLSSRHYPHITIRKCVSLIMEEESGHGSDVKTYVCAKLIGDGTDSAEMLELQSKVYQKSAGIFLWVVLVVPILQAAYDQGGGLGAMHKSLARIPKELGELFTNILIRDNAHLSDCLSLFQWILFARRPLSPHEIYRVIRGLSNPQITGDDQVSHDTVRLFLLQTSRGLVEISKSEPPVVQLIHETVQGFLRTRGLIQIAPHLAEIVDGSSHDKIKTDCARIIEQYAGMIEGRRFRKKWELEQYRKEVSMAFPLADYAADHLFEHADIAEQLNVSETHFLRLYRGHDSRLPAWVEIRNVFNLYKVNDYTPNVHIVYVIAQLGFDSLMRSLLEDSIDIDVNITGERFGNPLQAACVAGHETIARLLIESGSDINAEGGECGHAIFASIKYKKHSVTNLLVENDARPPVEALSRQLLQACARKDCVGLKVLVALGAPLDHRNSRGETPIYLAADSGNFNLVQPLIDRGAEVNAQGGNYGTALQAASVRGYLEIAQLLLDRGAEVNAQGGDYSTALHAASSKGSLEIVQLLLDRGAEVNAQGGHYGAALQAASAGGSLEIPQLVLDRGAEVNAQGGDHGTALHAASAGGSLEIVQLLLERGADVNIKGGSWDSALGAARVCRYIHVEQFLLEHGAVD